MSTSLKLVHSLLQGAHPDVTPAIPLIDTAPEIIITETTPEEATVIKTAPEELTAVTEAAPEEPVTEAALETPLPCEGTSQARPLPNKFVSCGTQWLADETGDALLLNDHTYCCVLPWNPHPVSCSTDTQPLTSTPKKQTSRPSPPLFHLKDDIADVTLSSINDDSNDDSFQISIEELNITIDSDVDHTTDDESDKFEKMCTDPKYIVFEDKLLELFKRCAVW
ncbi:hypothetical protein OS493_012241 [Desmophyllum pertusum]|uniref:Uncharacterized protein n=1 Tax=Desmophyllum pertusum TaxID=174260 RepID=A0A9W9ZS21_9CNID|nr:hypothetical protein OS493_012241 [Desmophyllum pertusum]